MWRGIFFLHSAKFWNLVELNNPLDLFGPRHMARGLRGRLLRQVRGRGRPCFCFLPPAPACTLLCLALLQLIGQGTEGESINETLIKNSFHSYYHSLFDSLTRQWELLELLARITTQQASRSDPNFGLRLCLVGWNLKNLATIAFLFLFSN